MNRQDYEDLIALCAREVNACGLDTPAGRRAAELKRKLEENIERYETFNSIREAIFGGAQ